jgi:hypothetical protein
MSFADSTIEAAHGDAAEIESPINRPVSERLATRRNSLPYGWPAAYSQARDRFTREQPRCKTAE